MVQYNQLKEIGVVFMYTIEIYDEEEFKTKLPNIEAETVAEAIRKQVDLGEYCFIQCLGYESMYEVAYENNKDEDQTFHLELKEEDGVITIANSSVETD